MRINIENATIINSGKEFKGAVSIEDDKIACVQVDGESGSPLPPADQVIDAEGLYLIPGVIDDHVHFREPGLTQKADILSESRAAAAGGVTSYMDMPNVLPQTTTPEAWAEKNRLAAARSIVNYAFFFGATRNNIAYIEHLNPQEVCGVKLFMGSSTGGMLVDGGHELEQIFRRSPILIMTHCEDSALISAAQARYRSLYGDDPEVKYHPMIRSEEACYRSTQTAVALAQQTGARLHVAHVSTARELELFDPAPLYDCNNRQHNKRITAEACIAHLLFSQEDYARLGTRIKCNPAIKTAADRQALREALSTGGIDLIGTDHAPHLLADKMGGCLRAASGMPMVQFSLPVMLTLSDQHVLSRTRVVELMCHAPARLFDIADRGFIREGMQADLVLLRPNTPHTVTDSDVLSKCGWTPLSGYTLNWRVEQTFCNGVPVYSRGKVLEEAHGQQLRFDR